MSKRKFQYLRRSKFSVLIRVSIFELEDVDKFLELARDSQRSAHRQIESLIECSKGKALDDWYVDDFSQLEAFRTLSTQFAIVGLWRCVEQFRKRSLLITSGQNASKKSYRHDAFQNELKNLGIDETKVKCAKSVNELRCLNNSIKHAEYVDDRLANFARWRGKRGSKIGDVEVHYVRLRPHAESYLTDLAKRLTNQTGL